MSGTGIDWGPTLATCNAGFNALSAVLLFTGWRAILNKRIARHRACMIAAFCVSVLFLASYLTRFYLTGVHPFPGQGWLRSVYFFILTTHTVLAAATPVLAIMALTLGLRGNLERHRKIGRIAFPIWMYVSVTGVAVYFLLYHAV